MTQPSPADTLRTAAIKLRATADRVEGGLAAALQSGGTRDLFGKPSPDNSTMHPGVGRALAQWLDEAVQDAEQIGPSPQALAVARAILGEDQP